MLLLRMAQYRCGGKRKSKSRSDWKSVHPEEQFLALKLYNILLNRADSITDFEQSLIINYTFYEFESTKANAKGTPTEYKQYIE